MSIIGMGAGLFGVFFSITVVVILIFIIVTIIKSIGTWNKNNHSPRLTVDALVSSKRTDVSSQQHAVNGDITGASGFHTTSSTTYYATFQVESGDRMEFTVSPSEYGMLAEGDEGRLTFQGTRYLGFERQGRHPY